MLEQIVEAVAWALGLIIFDWLAFVRVSAFLATGFRRNEQFAYSRTSRIRFAALFGLGCTFPFASRFEEPDPIPLLVLAWLLLHLLLYRGAFFWTETD